MTIKIKPMNKTELLQLTSKELILFLNSNIVGDNFQSPDAGEVKGNMITVAKQLFDSSIKISSPYYDNRELKIQLNELVIVIKVAAQKTGKTTNVSRLRKKDIKAVGKFKLHDIEIKFYNPYFEADNLVDYTVKVSSSTITGGARVSLKHRKEKIIDMLDKNILFDEIQRQDTDWEDIRKTVILQAAQPKIKKEYFEPNFNQAKWDIILQKTEEHNRELINTEIEKMFELNIV